MPGPLGMYSIPRILSGSTYQLTTQHASFATETLYQLHINFAFICERNELWKSHKILCLMQIPNSQLLNFCWHCALQQCTGDIELGHGLWPGHLMDVHSKLATCRLLPNYSQCFSREMSKAEGLVVCMPRKLASSRLQPGLCVEKVIFFFSMENQLLLTHLQRLT